MSHYRIVREPKGGPDIVLAASEAGLDTIKRAADILSVQGFTARLITLHGVDAPDALSAAERAELAPEKLPFLFADGVTDARQLAADARNALLHRTVMNKEPMQ